MSKNNIPCDTVRDLFPSYIDNLTSEATNTIIHEHIAECAECAEVLKNMRTPEAEPSAAAEKQPEDIDFLKKNKKRNLSIIIGSIAGALALVVVILALKAFVIGEANYSGIIAVRVDVSDSDITLTAVPVDSVHAISDLTFQEENGVVTVKARAVLTSFLHRGDLRRNYSAKEKIHRIELNGQIIWDEGAPISVFTSQVYNTRHDFMGSASDNLRTAYALSMNRYLGTFTSELKTSEKPYVWKIILDRAVPRNEKSVRERDMESFAYVLLGVIGNLDEVEYSYTVDSKACTKSVTAEDATVFFGRNIKDCSESPRVLGDLLNKTGLDTYAMGLDTVENDDSRNVTLNLVNFTENDIQAISYAIYSNGSLLSGGGSCNADNSPIKKGETFSIFFEYGDLGSAENITIELGIEMPDGKSYTLNDSLRVPAQSGVETTLRLRGSVKKGFRIEQ